MIELTAFLFFLVSAASSFYILNASALFLHFANHSQAHPRRHAIMPTSAPKRPGPAVAVFVGINIRGTHLTLHVGMIVTLLAIAVLAIF
jgi:hypothetical protein